MPSWIGATRDKRRRNPGAEDSDYAHAGYGAKDGPFNSIEELRLVAGMTNDIFRQIYPALTIHSRQPGIHPLTAPREVLLALPGSDAERIDTFIQNRYNQDTPGGAAAGYGCPLFYRKRGEHFYYYKRGDGRPKQIEAGNGYHPEPGGERSLFGIIMAGSQTGLPTAPIRRRRPGAT